MFGALGLRGPFDTRSEDQSGPSWRENEQARVDYVIDVLRCAYVRIDWDNPEK